LKRLDADGAMVFLPLLLIWMRDPMYFNAPCRWAVVLLAVSSGLLDPLTLSDPPLGAAASESSAEFDDRPAIDQRDAAAMDHDQPRPSEKQVNPVQARLREGTRIAPTVGRFYNIDGGWVFQSENPEPETATSQSVDRNGSASSGSFQLRVIENLTLQRVAQSLHQDAADNRWLVNGVITEYFGENRLIITAAIRANHSGASPS
jgi:hypothetical protein